MGNIKEGCWDCPYCGAKGIRGRETTCPTCGKQRDNSTKFYLKDDAPYVDTSEIKHFSKEPDWLCPYCNSYNPATEHTCRTCGHDRDSSDTNYFDEQRKNEEKEMLEEEPVDIPIEAPIMPIRKSTSNYQQKRYDSFEFSENRPQIIGFIVAILAILALTFTAIFLLVPKEADMTITNLQWEYTVGIEEDKVFYEDDWHLPAGGRLDHTNWEFSHYQDVLDHYETKTRTYTEQVLDGYDTIVTGTRDLGNGFFEDITTQVPKYRTETRTETYEDPVYRQDPVYATKYYYYINRWVRTRNIVTSDHNKSAYFGEYELSNVERAIIFEEKYILNGMIKTNKEEKSYTLNITKSQWESFNINDVIPVKVNNLGIVQIVENKKETTTK